METNPLFLHVIMNFQGTTFIKNNYVGLYDCFWHHVINVLCIVFECQRRGAAKAYIHLDLYNANQQNSHFLKQYFNEKKLKHYFIKDAFCWLIVYNYITVRKKI
jgi:hypothetical protein